MELLRHAIGFVLAVAFAVWWTRGINTGPKITTIRDDSAAEQAQAAITDVEMAYRVELVDPDWSAERVAAEVAAILRGRDGWS